MRVSVIIPTRNEAQAIGRVIGDLPADLVTEVIVVDNNSTDGTPEIAARMGARVMTEPRRGYGQTCLTGIAGASAPDVVTPGALPWHSVFGNWLAASLITSLYGVKISDLGPFRAARADALHAVELEETTYGWAVELILKGAKQGFRVVEVPVSYHPRIGKSKITGTFKGSVGAAWFILSRIARYYFRQRKNSIPRPM